MCDMMMVPIKEGSERLFCVPLGLILEFSFRKETDLDFIMDRPITKTKKTMLLP